MASESLSALIVFLLLCTSAGLGMYIRPRLSAIHRERETIELMQLTVGLMVTFAALVLGLLTASVRQQYAAAAHDRQAYALQLTQLDRCLRNYGPETDPARVALQEYTAAVIASTWPAEPPPAGVRYPDTSNMPRTGASPVLADLMNTIGVEINRMSPADGFHIRLAAMCLDRYRDVLLARLNVVGDAQVELLRPFYRILVFWLVVMFGCFGLLAPRHSLSMITIALCAILLSSVIFVILALGQPYGGYFGISSATMRTALNAMLSGAP
jgi:hypothetical protein